MKRTVFQDGSELVIVGLPDLITFAKKDLWWAERLNKVRRRYAEASLTTLPQGQTARYRLRLGADFPSWLYASPSGITLIMATSGRAFEEANELFMALGCPSQTFEHPEDA